MKFRDLQKWPGRPPPPPGPTSCWLPGQRDRHGGLPEPPQALVVAQGFGQGLRPRVPHLIAPEPEKVSRGNGQCQGGRAVCSRQAV